MTKPAHVSFEHDGASGVADPLTGRAVVKVQYGDGLKEKAYIEILPGKAWTYPEYEKALHSLTDALAACDVHRNWGKYPSICRRCRIPGSRRCRPHNP